MDDSQSNPLYRDGRHYDRMIEPLSLSDVPFYVEEARRVGGPVLELACGTGRITIPIAREGVEIVGLDLSPTMLACARRKAEKANVHITLVEADCRVFQLDRKFELIILPFNSMQHLHDYASLSALFERVREHLAPGGRFICDVFNPSIAILSRDPNERFVERQYEDPDGGGTVTLEQTAAYDAAAQVNRITWYFSLPDQKDFRVEHLDLRCFFPQELDLLLRANGLAIEKKFGNFERKSFASGDMKQIVVCRARTP
jgi:SAM-dependent methyltransferase